MRRSFLKGFKCFVGMRNGGLRWKAFPKDTEFPLEGNVSQTVFISIEKLLKPLMQTWDQYMGKRGNFSKNPSCSSETTRIKKSRSPYSWQHR